MGSSMSGSLFHENNGFLDVPIIDDDEPLVEVVKKLSKWVNPCETMFISLFFFFFFKELTFLSVSYLTHAIPDTFYAFEDMRSAPVATYLRPLVASLVEDSRNTMIITALM